MTTQTTKARMREVLRRAAQQFWHYARLHTEKNTKEGDQKAAINEEFAKMCEEAMGDD